LNARIDNRVPAPLSRAGISDCKVNHSQFGNRFEALAATRSFGVDACFGSKGLVPLFVVLL